MGLMLRDNTTLVKPLASSSFGASAAERITLCGGNRQLTDCAHSCQVALTGLPSAPLLLPSLSLKHITILVAVQIQEDCSSVCRRPAQTNSLARIHVIKPPSLHLSFTHAHKQTRVTCPVTPVSREFVKTTQGLEITFSQKPLVCEAAFRNVLPMAE